MKHLMVFLAGVLLLTACGTNFRELSDTLRYADNTPASLSKLRLQDLARMKRGEGCTLNFLYFLPLFGDGSLIRAAEDGGINKVELVGETGYWFFPFTRNCTVVYGDAPK